MKKTLPALQLFIAFLLLAGCGEDSQPITPPPQPPRELTPAEKSIVQSGNAFGLKLFQAVHRAERDSNIFISPFSVSMALGMTVNGANGGTKEAMLRTLELAGLTDAQANESYRSMRLLLTGLDPLVQFDVANSIWSRMGFSVEPDFIAVNRDYFNAETTSLDFDDPAAADRINAWVSTATKGKIREIVAKPIPGYVVMYLINAIYFSGTWKVEFKKEDTKDDHFIRHDGSRVPCRMMHQEGKFSYMENDRFQAVDLPYANGSFSMTLLLPRKTDDLDALINDMTDANWGSWMNSFHPDSGTVELPSFTLRYDKSLKDQLAAMGMGIAFTAQADLTRINRDGGLFITDVLHKTFVQVDEKGTEAAAVTAVIIGRGMPTLFHMRMDRPFLYVIREHHSGTILFAGKMMNPG